MPAHHTGGTALQVLSRYSAVRQWPDIAARLGGLSASVPRPLEWLFPRLARSWTSWKDQATQAALTGTDTPQNGPKERLAKEIDARHTTLASHLKPGVPLPAELVRAKLRFLVDGNPRHHQASSPDPPRPLPVGAMVGHGQPNRGNGARPLGAKLADMLRKGQPQAPMPTSWPKSSACKPASPPRRGRNRHDWRTGSTRTIYRLHKLTREEIALIESAAR